MEIFELVDSSILVDLSILEDLSILVEMEHQLLIISLNVIVKNPVFNVQIPRNTKDH